MEYSSWLKRQNLPEEDRWTSDNGDGDESDNGNDSEGCKGEKGGGDSDGGRQPGDPTTRKGNSPLKVEGEMHKLCPFCDEPLPHKRSQRFKDQLKALIDEAAPDPRPDNPRGMRISMARFISFCQQHKHEWDAVARAEKEGWPIDINFGALPQRVRDLKDDLQAILMDPEASTFFIQSRHSFGPGGSNSARIYSTIGKQGTAYYGEKGFIILVETLRTMFPQATTSIEALKPLDWGAVIEEVLLPEAAIMLIQQDKGVDTDEAMKIHSDSRVFGTVQHAVDE